MKRFFSLLLCVLMLIPACMPVLAEDTIVLNIEDGDALAGVVRLVTSGGEDLSFAIDGKAYRTTVGDMQFNFVCNGLDYGGGKLYYGTHVLASLPSASGKHVLQFDQKVFATEDIVITYLPASSEFIYGESPVYGTYNLDDQTVSKVSLTLPDGSTAEPDSVILHYPVVGSGEVTEETLTYSASENYSVGDGWDAETNLGGNTPDAPIYISFVFPDLRTHIEASVGYVAEVDTSALADGVHTLEVRAGGETVKQISFETDNTGPEITLDLAFGTALFADSTIDFSATDPAGEVKLFGDIDGDRYFPGRDLRYLLPGRHLLTVTATDPLGNVSVTCTEFRFCEKSEPVNADWERQSVQPILSGNVSEYVYQIGDATEFAFSYHGATSENGTILVELYDHVKGAYAEYGFAESGAETVFEVKEPQYIASGEVRVRVSPYVYTAISDTVVWVTDTQYYSNFEDLNHVYELILQYSVELFQNGKAGYLMHTGDIVDTHYDAEKAASEWQFAAETHDILEEAGMPNGVLAGNHDTGNVPPDLTNYKRYFGKRRYTGNPWYGGQLDNNACHYDLLTVAGTDYLFLYLSNGVEADDKTVAWANAVCKAYPNRTVILLTHAYLSTTGLYIANPADPTAYNHSRAREIADLIIAPNPNIAAVLCGHEHGAARVQREFGEGRYVWEILSDYQYAELGIDPQHKENGATLDGEGYIRLITFGENGAMHQTTYSPLHDDYNFFADDSDTFDVTLQVQQSNITLDTVDAVICFEKPAVETLAPVDEMRGIPVWVWIAVAVAVVSAVAVFAAVKVRKRR